MNKFQSKIKDREKYFSLKKKKTINRGIYLNILYILLRINCQLLSIIFDEKQILRMILYSECNYIDITYNQHYITFLEINKYNRFVSHKTIIKPIISIWLCI